MKRPAAWSTNGRRAVGFGTVVVLGVSVLIYQGGRSEKNPPTPANDAALSAARAKTAAGAKALLSDLASVTGLHHFGSATYDVCNSGQDTWTRVDPYRRKCTYRLTRFYGFDGGFSPKLLQVEAELTKQGWSAVEQGLPWVLENYYEYYTGDGRLPKASPRYLVSDLPSVSGYEKGGFKMDFNYGEAATRKTSRLASAQNTLVGALYTEYYHRENFVDVGKVLRRATSKHDYLLAISLEKAYWIVD